MGRRSRKRSRPASGRPAPRPGASAPPAAPEPSRSERRNAEVRAALKPLAPGERPGAVTAGAIIAALLALANLISYLAGLKVGGKRPAVGGIVLYEVLLLAAAAGMWRARYWAVLGFEFMLGFLVVILALLLTRASNLLAVVVVLGIGAPSAYLFWKLIRAMARIQMPEQRRPRR